MTLTSWPIQSPSGNCMGYLFIIIFVLLISWCLPISLGWKFWMKISFIHIMDGKNNLWMKKINIWKNKKKIMKKKTRFILALNFYFFKTNITSTNPLKKFKPCKFNNLNFLGDNTSNNYGCSSCCFHVVVVCTKKTLMKERGLTRFLEPKN